MSKKSQKQSPLDSEPVFSFVRDCIVAGDMNTTIVTKIKKEFDLDTGQDSMRRFRQRHGIQIPKVEKAYTKITGDTAIAQTAPKGYIRDMHEKPILDDPDAMMEQRGLDPEQWFIDSFSPNQWDGPQSDGNIVTYYQAKFTAKRKKPECQLLPPRSDGWKPPEVHIAPVVGQPELVVIVGDYHAPFHDLRLHDLFLEWLRFNRPSRGIDLGDAMDFPDISRHKDDPQNVADANECLQSSYNVRRGQVEASPATAWEWMPGNHDIRLRDYVIEKAPRLHGLKRADTPESYGEVVHDIGYLTRGDELGVRYVDPRGPYDLAQITLSKNLAVRHGWIVRSKGGESAYKSLEKTGYSILVGHTHRQALVQHSVPEIDGKMRQLLAAEIGCMCRVDPGFEERDEGGRMFPSYTPLPDWQQGFATAMIYPDGKFKVDLASFVNGVLLWQGQRFE